MSKMSQILHSATLPKNLKQTSRELKNTLQTPINAQQNGEKLVLVNAEILAELLETRLREEGLSKS